MPCTPERVFRAIQAAGDGGVVDAAPAAQQPHFDTDTPNQDPSVGSSEGDVQ
jgi:hypothetical protein